MYGNCINNYDEPICTTCDTSIKKVVLMYDDPVKDIAGDFYLAKATVNGNEAIQMFVKNSGNKVIDRSTPTELILDHQYVGVTISKGWYTLIKQ